LAAQNAAAGFGAGGRFAVVLGKGSAVTALPLSADRAAFMTLLGSLSPETLSSRGTNLENLLRAALQCADEEAESSGARRKPCIVLLTDGDALSGDLDAALAEAERDGVRVIALGAGSPEGAAVPGEEDQRSALKEDSLRRALEERGGVYIPNQGGAAERLARLLSEGADTGRWTETTEPATRQIPLAALAFLFLLLSEIVRYKRLL
jgi:Ca-activated chloride channel family protein